MNINIRNCATLEFLFLGIAGLFMAALFCSTFVACRYHDYDHAYAYNLQYGKNTEKGRHFFWTLNWKE